MYRYKEELLTHIYDTFTPDANVAKDAHTRAHARTHTNKHTHARAHIHTHAHTHTRTHRSWRPRTRRAGTFAFAPRCRSGTGQASGWGSVRSNVWSVRSNMESVGSNVGSVRRGHFKYVRRHTSRVMVYWLVGWLLPVQGC